MDRALILIWLFCMSLCLISTGCQNNNNSDKVIDVVIEGDEQFPEFLVGKWKADKSDWEINFEPEGKISSAVIAFGRVEMKPGRETRIPMKKGGEGIFKAGQWSADYDTETEELTVEITLEHFYIELGGGSIDGNSIDIFVGKVDEQAELWYASWTSFRKCAAHTDLYPNFNLSSDPVYGDTRQLIFKKIANKNNQ